jgi:quercetin dioxygenase-like cupin family protein
VTEAWILRRFETPDEVRQFEKGSFEIVRIGGVVVGRARYEPGWRWSTHVAPVAGTASCEIAHVGLVVSGRCAVRMDGGAETVLGPGDLFSIEPGHDSWVVGDEAYVSLHFLGADAYAAAREKR